MKFAHTKRLMLVIALALCSATSHSMDSDTSSNSDSNQFTEFRSKISNTLTDAYTEPAGAILYHLGIPVAIKLGELGIQGIVSLIVKTKDVVICYNYTPEEAKRELIAIQTADRLNVHEEKEVAVAAHFINAFNSLSGRNKMLGGDPKLEQHAAVLEKIDPDYAKFLLCINRHHNQKHLVAIVSQADRDPEYGPCRPPYSVTKYLENNSNGKRIKKYLQGLSPKEHVNTASSLNSSSHKISPTKI